MVPELLLGAAMFQPAAAPLHAVSFRNVRIEDRFWAPRQQVNREASVPHSLAMLDKAGNYLVMRLAAEGKREGYQGLLFTDSDLYKVIEGASYTLATHPDPKLESRLDEIIGVVAKAQMQDGYLNTWFQVTRPDQKWTNLRDHHELYCAGHMFEAAVAHFEATKKRSLLDIALKFADHIDKRFGPSGGPGYAGHPEIELALVKLWRATGDDRWFRLARKLTEPRGSAFFAEEHKTPRERYDGTYWLDDVPLTDHREIKGHAVRAAYLLAGVADVVRETRDPALTTMLDRVWRNATEKRIFVTGGIGPSGSNEGFTVDYDLPNLTAYQETCASIAMALWGHRMGLLHGEAKYWDAVETALYNGLLSGVALDGEKFFYVNPLASMGSHHRSEWFACACCPPNVLRTIASLGGYAYAVSDKDLYVNLYVGGSVDAQMGGVKASWSVATDYPWDGKVLLRPLGAGKHGLRLRIPEWCASSRLTVDGASVAGAPQGGYWVVPERAWTTASRVELELDMPVVQVESHPLVKENRGRAAVRRGPLVYCVEQVDNAAPVHELMVPLGADFKASYEAGVLGGVVVVETTGRSARPSDWERKLYQAATPGPEARVRLVPYGFWDNRAPGPMAVWLPTTPPTPRVLGPEGMAKVAMSFTSGNAQAWGVNDGIEPESSGQQPAALCHFWPHKGGEEWVQYTWESPLAVSGVEVYWFDDTGRGECRLPVSWRLETLVGVQWSAVELKEVPIAMDKWCKVAFAPIETTALRLVVKQQDGWSSGIHEWKVIRSD